jgi:hypothetical protein
VTTNLAPEAVRATTEAILSDPRFAPQTSFWQWFVSLFADSHAPDLGHLDPWGQILFWGIAGWSILTLVAILAHFAWSVLVATGTSRALRSPAASGESPRVDAELLEQQARNLAAAGRHREAMGKLTLALLERLQRSGLVATHDGKTNGDYLRELSTTPDVAAPFARFSTLADTSLYGAAPVGESEYEQLRHVYGEICTDVP